MSTQSVEDALVLAIAPTPAPALAEDADPIAAVPAPVQVFLPPPDQVQGPKPGGCNKTMNFGYGPGATRLILGPKSKEKDTSNQIEQKRET